MSEQLGLNYDPPVGRQFHYGPGYEPKLDQVRWGRHCSAVHLVLTRYRHQWFTYEDLAHHANVPVGSVRTRVSNLRAGGVEIETRVRPDRFREIRIR